VDAAQFTLDGSILGREPQTLVGGFAASGLRAAAEACTDLDEAFQDAVQTLAAAGITGQNAVERPEIGAWREAMRASGLSPSKHRGSVEQLVKRVLKKGIVQTPLPLVSLYCAVSAKYLAPLGAYDLDRLSSPSITLRLGRPETDSFEPLGGGDADMPITDQVAVYAIGDQVICWSYNVRDSRETCLTADSDRGIFLGEAVDPSQQKALRGALYELGERLTKLGAAVGEIAFFDASQPSGALAPPVPDSR
jgi:DNA/RNA-binding domain of Phe-tRNA-synthetase-like protein